MILLINTDKVSMHQDWLFLFWTLIYSVKTAPGNQH